MEEAKYLCHRVAIMDNGRIVALDTPENLVRKLPVPYEIKIRTDNGHDLQGLESLAAVESVGSYDDGAALVRSKDASATLPEVVDLANTQGARITHLEVIPANLEDVFLSLTGRELRE
jgi:ABC-2 type transport system ATP-binding protein